MTDTDDGFEVARRDLELRGPGDFFRHQAKRGAGFPHRGHGQRLCGAGGGAGRRARLVADASFWTSPEYGALRDYLRREQVFQGELID